MCVRMCVCMSISGCLDYFERVKCKLLIQIQMILKTKEQDKKQDKKENLDLTM